MSFTEIWRYFKRIRTFVALKKIVLWKKRIFCKETFISMKFFSINMIARKILHRIAYMATDFHVFKIDRIGEKEKDTLCKLTFVRNCMSE